MQKLKIFDAIAPLPAALVRRGDENNIFALIVRDANGQERSLFRGARRIRRCRR